MAGAILGINPFNQPDVESAKIRTRELTTAFEKTGALPAERPVMSLGTADLYTDGTNAADPHGTSVRSGAADSAITRGRRGEQSCSKRAL